MTHRTDNSCRATSALTDRKRGDRLRKALVVGLVFLTSLNGQMNEYQVKAAFLYNFAKFVEWPAEAFNGPGDPIGVCVLGANPFGRTLDDVLAGKEVVGRRLVVRDAAMAPAMGCHILFVGAEVSKHLKTVPWGKGVLVVGEAEGFAARGGIINFRLEGGRVRFEINVDAAEQAQLRLSSKLLSLAHIVRGGTR